MPESNSEGQTDFSQIKKARRRGGAGSGLRRGGYAGAGSKHKTYQENTCTAEGTISERLVQGTCKFKPLR